MHIIKKTVGIACSLFISGQVFSATIVLSNPISTNTTINSVDTYVIESEVHVLRGVTLTIENNAKIFIKNGLIKKTSPNSTQKATLVFDTGSNLLAENVTFAACDKNNLPEKKADNGGVFFLGSSSRTQRDLNIQTDLSTSLSSFKITKIKTEYLGGIAPKKIGIRVDDFDSLQLIGLNSSEWNVQTAEIIGSGDDGLDLEDSFVTIRDLTVTTPIEDGINLSNSRLNITENLVLNVGITTRRDRDLFDVEVDRSPSIIRLAQNCTINLNGIFGNQVWLKSDDLPQKKIGLYQYNGKATKGQSYIYSMTKD